MNLNLIRVLFLLLIEILNVVLMMRICCYRRTGYEKMNGLGLLNSLCEMMNSYEIYLYPSSMVWCLKIAVVFLLNKVYFPILLGLDLWNKI